MEVVIITGLSGAGKTKAADWFEDKGYYCIDNMPPALIKNFIDLALSGTKEVVDSQVEDALLQKALGYESVERKVEVSAKGERKEVSTVKQVGPDVSAISLWLKKRRPEQGGDGESVQALPESNLLTLLSWERGELDGISELQPTAEADHDLVEPQGVPRTGRSDL